MKILLLSDSFLPSLGGVEQHVNTLYKYLTRFGIDVKILTSTKLSDADHSLNVEYNIDRNLDLSERSFALQWPYTFIKNSKKILNVINTMKSDYDVIHYHGSHILHLSKVKEEFNLVNTRHGILPACIGFWGIDDWCGKKPSSLRCAFCVSNTRRKYLPLVPVMSLYASYYYPNMKKSLNRINRVINVSNFVQQVIYNAYKNNNMKVIYNFIDYKNDVLPLLDKKNYLNDGNDGIKLMYSGRLDYQKGIHLLLESFNNISQHNKNIELMITGSGELEKVIKDYSMKNDKVKYLGYLSRKDQLNVLNESDIFVAPSIYPDACPTSIIEAMSLGKPVISTFAGGIPELVENGITGYLAKQGDSMDLTDKINKILDKDLNTFREKSIKKSTQFDIEHIGPIILNEYKSIIDEL